MTDLFSRFRFLLTALCMIVFCNTAFGYDSSNLKTADKKNVYYVSSSGNNRNDGLTPNTPKKTFTNLVQDHTIVLLKSGDTFLTDGVHIEGCENFTLSTYGGTDRAVVSGLRKSWTVFEQGFDYGKDIYRIYLGKKDIGHIQIDNVKSWTRCDTFEQIGAHGDWYYDMQDGYLYYKSAVNVTGKKIQYAYQASGIVINNSDQISVQNIEVCSYAKHGINIGENVNGCKIVKNYVHDIGNSFQYDARYGNGIQMWLINEQNIEIRQNIVTDCFDAGITPQVNKTNKALHKMDNKNIVISQNYIDRCAYPIEVFTYQGGFSTIDTYIEYNFLNNCSDITEGHRGGANRPSYEGGKFGIGQLQLWNINGSNQNHITIRKNISIGSCDYAIVFSADSGGQYDIYDNVFIIKGSKFINNETYYHGDKDTMITISDEPLTQEDSEKVEYYRAKARDMVAFGS